jgi:hypothetical protein
MDLNAPISIGMIASCIETSERAKYFEACLRSILHQHVKLDVLIIGYYTSDDVDTLFIKTAILLIRASGVDVRCVPFTSKRSQFRIYSDIVKACSEFNGNSMCIFSDDDDLWDPVRVSVVMHAMSKLDPRFLAMQPCHVVSYFDEDKKTPRVFRGKSFEIDKGILEAKDVTDAINSGHLGRIPSIKEHVPEYWEMFPRLSRVREFFDECNDCALLDMDVCDTYFAAYLFTADRTVYRTVKMDDYPDHWYLYYRQHSTQAALNPTREFCVEEIDALKKILPKRSSTRPFNVYCNFLGSMKRNCLVAVAHFQQKNGDGTLQEISPIPPAMIGNSHAEKVGLDRIFNAVNHAYVRMLLAIVPSSHFESCLERFKKQIIDANQSGDSLYAELLSVIGRARCIKCGKSDARNQLCSQCKCASYCSKECQKSDWNRHRGRCKLLRDVLQWTPPSLKK